MQWHGNTIEITGGASGIGLGLATRLVEPNTVIFVGRDKEKLAAARRLNSKLQTFACDVGLTKERLRLIETMKRLLAGQTEIAYESAVKRSRALRDEFDSVLTR